MLPSPNMLVFNSFRTAVPVDSDTTPEFNALESPHTRKLQTLHVATRRGELFNLQVV